LIIILIIASAGVLSRWMEWWVEVTYAVGGRCGGWRHGVAGVEHVDCTPVEVVVWCRGKDGRKISSKILHKRSHRFKQICPKRPHKCSQLNPRPSPTASQPKPQSEQMKVRKDLSDIPPNPPSTAGRSQTLYWVEIIAAQQAAHVGITLGLGASAHQPGWSLWLM
jgi:hypothetical protein